MKNFSTLFAEELARPVTIIENGKCKKIPKRQALVKQVINRALSNDVKAAALIFDQIQRREGLAPVQQVKMNMTAEEFEAIVRKVANEL